MPHPPIDPTLDRIEHFCQYFKLTHQEVEENVHDIDQYRLYLPGTNSVDAEALEECRVYRSIIRPGVHTLRNGDPGYPDEYDEQELGRGGLIDCLELIGHAVVTAWCDDERLAESFACEAAQG